MHNIACDDGVAAFGEEPLPMTAAWDWNAPPPPAGPPPPRCAYCGAGPPEVACGVEHEAWAGARLCKRCYAAVCAEVPVLPGHGRRQRPLEGDVS